MVLKEEHLPLAITQSANGVLGSRESEETGSNGNNRKYVRGARGDGNQASGFRGKKN